MGFHGIGNKSGVDEKNQICILVNKFTHKDSRKDKWSNIENANKGNHGVLPLQQTRGASRRLIFFIA
jgi:hypothetical protein